MKVKEIIAILKQFDPEKKVVIDAGGAILIPGDIEPHDGDILVNAYSERFKAVLK